MTAALFASVAPWARGQSPYRPLLHFWTAVRRHWLQATLIGLIDLILGGLVALNLLSIRQMDFGQFITLLPFILTLFFAIALILTNVYIWPLLVTLDQPLTSLIKNAVMLALGHPFWGGLVAIIALIPLGIGLVLPRFFFLTVAFAITAFITYWGAWRMIRRYLDQDDLQKFGV